MRVLVTGGAGFIGSHIVDALVDDGHEVSVVDDLTSGREADLNPGARLFTVDITHYDALHRAFEEARPEVVYHLAAQSTVARSMEDPYGDSLVNVGGTINVLRLCVKSGADRIVFASSSAVYGDPSYVPMDETHPVNPRSGYGISKSTAERYVKLFSDTHGLSYKLFRCGNVYGPRQMPGGEAGVIAIFAGQMLRGTRPTIFGDGRKTRDYVYVGDVVKANLLAMDGRGDNDVYNIAGGAEVQDIRIFEEVRRALGSTMEPSYGDPRPGDPNRVSLDCSKAAERLRWRASVSLADGVQRSVDWLRRSMEP